MDQTAAFPHLRRHMRPQRLVVFAESPFRSMAGVLDAALSAARRHPAVETVAVVNSARAPAQAPFLSSLRGVAVELTHHVINPEIAVPFSLPSTRGIASVARRHGFGLTEPEGHDLNSAAFLEYLRTEARPTLALVFGSLQIFRRSLLSSFERVVNFHDGLLPDYRGLRATSWSLYNGEARTGFAFHDMVLGIDEGPVISTGSIPVEPGVSVALHRHRKMTLAAATVPDVLEKLVAGEPGVPQPAGGAYYSGADARAVTTIAAPDTFTAAELRRRVLAFGELTLIVGGRPLPVTALTGASPGRRLSFCTADGVWLRPSRLGYLPPAIHTAVRRNWVRSRTRRGMR